MMGRIISIFIIALILVTFVNPYPKSYHGYKLIRIRQKTPQQLEVLKQLQHDGIYFTILPVDPIRPPSQILLAPEQEQFVLETIESAGMKWEILHEDIQKTLDQGIINTDKVISTMLWDRYYSLADIYKYLELQVESHSNYTSLFSIGKSFEGTELLVIKISKESLEINDNKSKQKPAVWIDSLIHSREWITGAVGLFLINQLLNHNQNDTEIQSWLQNYDFYYLPVFNVDGYNYTFTSDRFWRKTRSVHNEFTSESDACRGTDANRNFDFAFLDEGASNDSCSTMYAGPTPFSEPETLAVSNFINSISAQLVFYLSLHSSGQFILIPFGNSNEPIPQYEEYMNITRKVAAAHAKRNGTKFVPGNVADLMYEVSGSSMDWVKYTHNTTLTLTYELRDQGKFGPYLPSNQIYDSGMEFLDGFRVLMNELGNMLKK